MNDAKQHTPTPWAKEYCGKDRIKIFKTSDKRRIATVNVKYPTMDEANAEFIVMACNSHADLLAEVAELRESLRLADDYLFELEGGA